MSDSVAYPWSGGLRSSSRKRRLLFASSPFMAIGLVLLSLSLFAPPMVTAISDDRQNIPRSPAAGHYYFFAWWAELSAAQRAEFQFSSNQPMDFAIIDRENYDLLIQNQTIIPITWSHSEFENTHSFTPTKSDTYYFILQNISGQDATVTATIRVSLTGLGYIGVVLVLGGVLMTLGFALKPRAVDNPAQVLGMIKMHGRIMIGELASRFSTTQTDIELTFIKLRNMGEPISYLAATGEVWYGSQPRPPEPPTPPPTSIEPASQPSNTTES